MKKVTSVFLAILLIFTLAWPAQAESVQSAIGDQTPTALNFSGFSKTAGFHFDFMPAGSIWKGMVAGQTAAKLNAVYTLKDDVVKVSPNFDQQIKSATQLMLGSSNTNTPAMRLISNGAFVSKSALEATTGVSQVIQADTVFVNEQTGTAFKVVVAMDGDDNYQTFKDYYAITQPQIHEVVDYFEIPMSDIALNKANITSFAGLPNSTTSSVENYVVKSGMTIPLSTTTMPVSYSSIKDPLIQFDFPEGTELNATAGGQNITVKVSGGIAVGNLGLEAKYSGFNGYYFALKIAEEAYLNVDVGINIKQEIRIPILGIDVPFGIGRVSGGLFVVVGLDGKVTIQMEAREYISSKMGVKGDTFLYAPVSCKPFFSMPEKSFTGDVHVDGKINGYVKAGALLSLEIFGWDLVGAGVFIGSGVNISSLPDNLLDIELYGLIQVYITFAGNTYYLIHFKPTLLRKQQKNMGGYRATVEEVCAYQDIVVGYLQKSVTQGGNIVLQKAANTQFDILVTNLMNVTTTYPKNGKVYWTDEDGRFLVRDFPAMDLKVNDKVSIRVYDQDRKEYGPSKPVAATYPFRNIRITAADAFNDWIEGQVEPARVRNWDKQPGEDDYKMLRFSGMVGIDIQSVNNQNYLRQTLYTVHVTTDDDGFFKAINGRLRQGDPVLDFKNDHRFTAFIDQDNALVSVKSYVVPYTHFVIKTVSETVLGSSVRYAEGSDTIDRVSVKTRLYVINMGGSRQLTNVQTAVTLFGLSAQDRGTNGYWAYNPSGETQWYSSGDSKTVNNVKHDLVFRSEEAIPIESSANLQMINDQTNGTSYVDLLVVKEWVWPAHSNPTVITSPDHTEITTEGGTFLVTAIGDEPIRFSAKPAIPGVALAKNGLMTMAPGMTPGVYKMTIEAAAKAGDSPIVFPGVVIPGTKFVYSEDAYPPVYQDFTLTVTVDAEPTVTPTMKPTPLPTSVPVSPTIAPTAAPTATPTMKPTPLPTPVPVPPTIISARSVTIYRPFGGTFQVTATGTLPIAYSLSPLPDQPDSPIPDGVSIDETTGLMTVAGWVPVGEYYFNINAKNKHGADQQTFALFVRNRIVFSSNIPASPNALLTPISSFLSAGDLSANFTSTVHPKASAWRSDQTGAPEYVLRNDDDKDLYSQDMLFISGAEYVKYDIMVEFYADGDRYVLREYDKSPCNDHHGAPMTEDEKKAIEDYFKNRGMFIEYNRNSFGPDIESRLDPITIDDFMDVFIFDYGSVVSSIQALQKGNLKVGLGGEIGTIIPGSIFGALKEAAAKNISLTLTQEGAAVTFMSGSIGSIENGQRFDVAFSNKAVSETAMKEAAGHGAASFTFAFAHHNNLPGFARFDIVTDIAAGQSVNVYKYDVQSSQFTAIAEGVTVAESGIVTYMNNTMSEYLITTATIKNAVKGDAYLLNQQRSEKGTVSWLYYVGGALLLVLLAGIVLILVKRRLPNPV